MKIIYRDKMFDMTEMEVYSLLKEHGVSETCGCSESSSDGWVLYSGDENIWVQEHTKTNKDKKILLVEYIDYEVNAWTFENREMAEQEIFDKFWACVGFWNVKSLNEEDDRIEIETKEGLHVIWMILEV